MMVMSSPAKMGLKASTGRSSLKTDTTPGSWVISTAVNGALTPFGFRTTTSTDALSGSSNGTRALMWLGDTRNKPAGRPLKNTWVPEPASWVCTFTPGAVTVVYTVSVARPAPKMDTMEPRATTGTL
jgi:hypothetical protein